MSYTGASCIWSSSRTTTLNLQGKLPLLFSFLVHGNLTRLVSKIVLVINQPFWIRLRQNLEASEQRPANLATQTNQNINPSDVFNLRMSLKYTCLLWQDSPVKKESMLSVWIMCLVLCISFKVSHQNITGLQSAWVSLWSVHIQNNPGFSEEQHHVLVVD